MSGQLFQAIYRATVCDTDDTTPLTPIPGAPHTDAFKVATSTGVAGFQPYMMDPHGSHGALDVLTGRAEIAEVMLGLLDVKIGGANLIRWATAYYGDLGAHSRLPGLKVIIEESTDGGATWADWYVGRIYDAQAPDPGKAGPVLNLAVRDNRVYDTRDVFVGIPHHSVSYARMARLLPLGVKETYPAFESAWNTYGWGYGKVMAQSINGRSYWAIYVTDGVNTTSSSVTARYRATQALMSGMDTFKPGPYGLPGDYASAAVGAAAGDPAGEKRPFATGLRVKMTWAGGSGDFLVCMCKGFVATQPYDGGATAYAPMYLSTIKGKGDYVAAFGVTPLPTTHPLHASVPADGTAVRWVIESAMAPTPDAPLFIDAVDLGTLAADAAAGLFSTLNDTCLDGAPNDGSVAVKPIPTDASSFSGLATSGDTPLPKVHMMIDRPWKLSDLLQNLTRSHHVAFVPEANGALYAKDMRPAEVAMLSAPTLGNDDYVATSLDWEDGKDIQTLVVVKQYADMFVGMPDESGDPPSWPPTLIKAQQIQSAEATPKFGSFQATQPLVIDAIGIRGFPGNFGGPVGSASDPKAAAEFYVNLFGGGAGYLTGTFRRTSNTTGVWPGDWVKINLDPVPNAATNMRGGTRAMLCLERTVDGPTIQFRFLDGGGYANAAAPTIGTLALDTTNPHNVVRVPLTLNAAGDLACLLINITATSVGTHPVNTDPGWTRAGSMLPAGTIPIFGLPSGKRVWVDAVSVPVSGLPSVRALGGYIDTTALAAPSGLVATVNGQSCVLTWTNGEANFPVMPVLDGVNALDRPLPLGSTSFTFDSLSVGSHTVGVETVDAYGGTSAVASTSITTTAATQLAAPRLMEVAQGRGANGRDAAPASAADIVGYGVELYCKPAEQLASLHWQVAQNNGFVPVEAEFITKPGLTRLRVPLPLDGIQRYFRAASTQPGYTESDWSPAASAFPAPLLADEGAITFPTGWAFLVLDRTTAGSGDVLLDIGTDSLDTDRVYYDVSAAGYPAVDTTKTMVDVANLPLSTSTGITLTPGQAAYLVVGFYNDALGFGAFVRHRVVFDTGNGAQVPGSVGISLALTPAGGVADAQLTVRRPPSIISATPAVGSFKYAASTSSMPSSATVRAATAINFTPGMDTYTVDLGNISSGQTIYVALFGYSGFGGAGTELDGPQQSQITYTAANVTIAVLIGVDGHIQLQATRADLTYASIAYGIEAEDSSAAYADASAKVHTADFSGSSLTLTIDAGTAIQGQQICAAAFPWTGAGATGTQGQLATNSATFLGGTTPQIVVTTVAGSTTGIPGGGGIASTIPNVDVTLLITDPQGQAGGVLKVWTNMSSYGAANMNNTPDATYNVPGPFTTTSVGPGQVSALNEVPRATQTQKQVYFQYTSNASGLSVTTHFLLPAYVAHILDTGAWSVSDLASITQDMGTIVTGTLAAGTVFAGSLSAATGTFAGDISAASGTFSGTVSGSILSGNTARVGDSLTVGNPGVTVAPSITLHGYTLSGADAGTCTISFTPNSDGHMHIGSHDGILVAPNIQCGTVDCTGLTISSQAVSFGAADSAGTGYRQVRVPN